MNLWVTVVKEVGYYDVHPVGEKIKIPLRDVNMLIRDGYVDLIVNNKGNNLPYDEAEETGGYKEQEMVL